MSTKQDHGEQPVRQLWEADVAGVPFQLAPLSPLPQRPTEGHPQNIRTHQAELETQNNALCPTQIAQEDTCNRYANLFEFLPIGCVGLTWADTIGEINFAGAALLGAERNALLHHRFDHFILPADRDCWNRYLANLTHHASGNDCELRLLRSDGSTIYAKLAGISIQSTDGQRGRYITLTDITAQKQMAETIIQYTAEADARAQSLAEAERFAHSIIDALPSRLCVLDENGRIIATNRAWREQISETTYENMQHIGEDIKSLSMHWVMPCWSQATTSDIDHAIQDLLAGKCQKFSLEYQCRSHTPFRWFETRITRLPGDGLARLVMTHDEITERKHAEEAQRRGAERLKQLGAHLESVREEQSAMIARELHDELGALLTMLKLDLATTAEQVKKSAPMRVRFDGLLDQVCEALQVVKRISTDLRPATLDTLGLIATIKWYVDQFSRTSGITTELQLPEYVRLSDVAAIAVFRIIQEGLTNVVTHAGASKVTIHVHKQTSELIVEIIDNGSGITESDLQRLDSFGIIGMRERADYLGGTLAIRGKPQEGTQLTLRIPLDSR